MMSPLFLTFATLVLIHHVVCEEVLNCGSNYGYCVCEIPSKTDIASNLIYTINCTSTQHGDIRLSSSVLEVDKPPVGAKLTVVVAGGRTLGVDATFLLAWLQYGYANLIIKDIETVLFAEVSPLPYLKDPFHIYAGVELINVGVEKLPAGLFQGAARASLHIKDSFVADLAEGLFREIGSLGSLKVTSSHIGGVSGPLSDIPIILGGVNNRNDTIIFKDSVVGLVADGAFNFVAQQPQLVLMDNVTIGTLQESSILLDGQVNLAFKGCKVKNLASKAIQVLGSAAFNLTDSEVQTTPNALSNLTCDSLLYMNNNKFYSIAEQELSTRSSMSKASLDELVSSIESMHQQKILSNSVIIDPSCRTAILGPSPLVNKPSSTLLTIFVLSLLCNIIIIIIVAVKVVGRRSVYGKLNDRVIMLDPMTGDETSAADCDSYDNAEHDQNGFRYATLI